MAMDPGHGLSFGDGEIVATSSVGGRLRVSFCDETRRVLVTIEDPGSEDDELAIGITETQWMMIDTYVQGARGRVR